MGIAIPIPAVARILPGREMVKVNGAFDSRESRHEVYEFVSDPRRLAKVLPDVDRTDVSESTLVVRARAGLGPLSGAIEVRMRVVDRQPDESVSFRGDGSGIGSHLEMGATFTFADREGGGTHVTWTGEATISGALGPFAGPALDPIAQRCMSDFVSGMERALASPSPPGPAP